MFGSALVVLQGIMLLLLLAVCGNVANLMLARATVRQREVGVHAQQDGVRAGRQPRRAPERLGRAPQRQLVMSLVAKCAQDAARNTTT